MCRNVILCERAADHLGPARKDPGNAARRPAKRPQVARPAPKALAPPPVPLEPARPSRRAGTLAGGTERAKGKTNHGRGNLAAARDRGALRRIREAKADSKNQNQKAAPVPVAYRPSGILVRGGTFKAWASAPRPSFDRAAAEADALWGESAERLAEGV